MPPTRSRSSASPPNHDDYCYKPLSVGLLYIHFTLPIQDGYPPMTTAVMTAAQVMLKVLRYEKSMFKPIQLAYRAYRKALRHPKYRLWVISGTLLWLVNPINAVPVLGEIDDAVVLTILTAEVSQMALEGIKNRKQRNAMRATPKAATTTELVES